MALAGLLAGCAPPPPPPPPPPAPPPPPPYVFPYDTVWSATPGVELRSDSGSIVVPRPFTPLRVVEADSTALLVSCDDCEGTAREGRVGHSEVVFSAVLPEEAAREGLAEFALAVREAARRHDVAALRSVMVHDFTFSFLGVQGADPAIAAWESESFESLDRVPALLDRGLATQDSVLWVAPPDHLESLDYRGLRLGFRRSAGGRWEWVFLVRSEVGG